MPDVHTIWNSSTLGEGKKLGSSPSNRYSTNILRRKVKAKKLRDSTSEELDKVINYALFLVDSEFILGCENILYEIARGLYNNNINKIWKTKKEKELVIELWETLYLNIRTKIWLHRCNEVIEEEKKKGITKRDKKLYNENKRKKDESEVEKNEIHETYRKNQKH
ncbi:hypothetical protein GLOIN_2v1773302 [Rhizophagus irregularis DAOM 181602=DAOM 197198]|uniref:Uncharacterized protein n=1 Tax=Rhizophagus irregularis (strain DAOM 181602 / DAOM 197198 / MUCL 43194) TaxID=747089 RepID=A0A2P4Q5B6_RHIID|nr:hypothetical protein GLOIN_2v1773302 [Rhizophagus irregularis DAOM 181602=DAOM 197198]POG72836.1 hypothetical protein GLOIN_2v1773302 [Rhizophagus irregularis DAOM 181602=DAOM 197198]|eukprot:XP_025179702.1 hypothetical protein GLOIN_2v1773302 [Rhizophagus irregularis DAOM 181602=DAOM 197198]